MCDGESEDNQRKKGTHLLVKPLTTQASCCLELSLLEDNSLAMRALHIYLGCADPTGSCWATRLAQSWLQVIIFIHFHSQV